MTAETRAKQLSKQGKRHREIQAVLAKEGYLSQRGTPFSRTGVCMLVNRKRPYAKRKQRVASVSTFTKPKPRTNTMSLVRRVLTLDTLEPAEKVDLARHLLEHA